MLILKASKKCCVIVLRINRQTAVCLCPQSVERVHTARTVPTTAPAVLAPTSATVSAAVSAKPGTQATSVTRMWTSVIFCQSSRTVRARTLIAPISLANTRVTVRVVTGKMPTARVKVRSFRSSCIHNSLRYFLVCRTLFCIIFFCMM